MYFKLDSNVPSGGSQYEHLYAYIGCIGRVQRHFFFIRFNVYFHL